MSLFTINSSADNSQWNESLWRQYAFLYLVAVLVFCLLVGGFNALVDPHGRLLWLDRAGLNQVKMTVPSNNRAGKALALRQCNYDTIIVGTSRAESGIVVDQPAFEEALVYNAAMKSASMYEMRHLIEYGLKHQELKRVVIGFDFMSFNERLISFDDFADSPLAQPQSVASLLRYLISWGTLQESWITLELNRSGRFKSCQDDGEYKARAGSKKSPSIRIAFDFILRRYAGGQYREYVIGEEHLESLAAVLTDLDAAGVQVYGFISPMHVMHAETIREMGLLADYQGWKRQLVDMFAAHQQAELWDFSGYSEITTEVVPSVDGEKMWGYTDSAHYRPVVGSKVIAKMYDLDSEESAPNFGVRLSPANIDAVIAADEQDSAAYRRSNANEIQRMQDMVNSSPYRKPRKP